MPSASDLPRQSKRLLSAPVVVSAAGRARGVLGRRQGRSNGDAVRGPRAGVLQNKVGVVVLVTKQTLIEPLLRVAIERRLRPGQS